MSGGSCCVTSLPSHSVNIQTGSTALCASRGQNLKFPGQWKQMTFFLCRNSLTIRNSVITSSLILLLSKLCTQTCYLSPHLEHCALYPSQSRGSTCSNVTGNISSPDTAQNIHYKMINSHSIFFQVFNNTSTSIKVEYCRVYSGYQDSHLLY